VALDETRFDLFNFLLIMAQFGSIQKMKSRKGRVISEEDAEYHLELARISLDCCPTKGQQI
jgi:hypothetical protein